MSDFKKFTYELTIREFHLDTFGHVNNATYLELLEEARWELLTAQGFGMEKIQAMQQGPIVLDCHIRFLKELKLRQQIIIESQVLSYDKKIAVMRQEIFNEKAECCSRAKLMFGFFDMKARKLILPSIEWMHAIGRIR